MSNGRTAFKPIFGPRDERDRERFPWTNPKVYDLTVVPPGPFWIQRVYPELAILGAANILEGGYGKGRFVLNAPSDRQWRAVGVDCDPAAYEGQKELIEQRGWSDVPLLGDLVANGHNLEQYHIRACVGMMFFHTLSPEAQFAVLKRMCELLPPGGKVYGGFLAHGGWRYRRYIDLTGESPLGKQVNLREVMELDSVGVDKDLWFTFNGDGQILDFCKPAGFAEVEIIDTTEGCGWHHLVDKYGDQARFERWYGAIFTKAKIPEGCGRRATV